MPAVRTKYQKISDLSLFNDKNHFISSEDQADAIHLPKFWKLELSSYQLLFIFLDNSANPLVWYPMQFFCIP